MVYTLKKLNFAYCRKWKDSLAPGLTTPSRWLGPTRWLHSPLLPSRSLPMTALEHQTFKMSRWSCVSATKPIAVWTSADWRQPSSIWTTTTNGRASVRSLSAETPARLFRGGVVPSACVQIYPCVWMTVRRPLVMCACVRRGIMYRVMEGCVSVSSGQKLDHVRMQLANMHAFYKTWHAWSAIKS